MTPRTEALTSIRREVAAVVGACLAEESCDTIWNGPYDACWDRARAEVAPSAHLLEFCPGYATSAFDCGYWFPVEDCRIDDEHLDGRFPGRPGGVHAGSHVRRGRTRVSKRGSGTTDDAVAGACSGCWCATLAAGCGRDDGGGPAPGVTLHPVPGCEAIDPAPCDVFDTSCQTRLLELAACMRGSSPGALPPISRMTEAEYTQYLMAELAAEEPDPDLDHFELGLEMLGLVAPGAFTPSSMAAAQAAAACGLLPPDDLDDIVLIDHGPRRAADDIQVNGTMLHELVHALQDRDQDLTPGSTSTGTATMRRWRRGRSSRARPGFTRTRFRVSLLGLDPAAIDWSKHFDSTVRQGDAVDPGAAVAVPGVVFGVPLRVRRPADQSAIRRARDRDRGRAVRVAARGHARAAGLSERRGWASPGRR